MEYPILDDKLQYFKTTFPVGLRYSKGWYGTFRNAPLATEILLFDDNKGICIFSMPLGQSPGGEQGGTKLTPITLDEANKIIQSYPLEDAFTPVDAEITVVMDSNDYFTGVWAGDKLSQKWTANDGTEKPTDLTPKQQAFLDAKATLQANKQPIDLSQYDPDRFWVLGGGVTANWSDNAGHWSATTGGLPGASLPTSADNVYFDANSFLVSTGTVTVDVTANCLSMDWTGVTNTPTLTGSGGIYVNVYGSLTFITGMTLSDSVQFGFLATSGSWNINTAGKTFTNNVGFFGSAGAGWTLQSNMSCGYATFNFTGGTLDTGGYSMTSQGWNISGSIARTLNLNNSIITIQGGSASWSYTGSNFTLNASTSSIRLQAGTFAGGGLTYNEVQLNGTSHTISGNNTFTNLILQANTTQTITFTDSSTQTITTPTITGSAGKVKTLQGSSTGGWNIVKAGGGIVSADYLSISYSTATPATTWYAGANSTDGGNNSGWIFTNPPATTGGVGFKTLLGCGQI